MSTKNQQRLSDITMNELRDELSHFTGTSGYHRHWLRLLYTDGVQHLAERMGAYWLIDAIASWQPKAATIDPEFQLWELTVEKDRAAVLAFRQDEGRPAAIEQKIEYADFPPGSIRLYVQNGVLLLPSEY